jgi:hypothetical protein
MNAKEVKLIQDVFAHYRPGTVLDDETINNIILQYGNIRAVLRNLIIKFEPKAQISEAYLDAKLKSYGILDDAIIDASPVKQTKNKNLILIGVFILSIGLVSFGINYYKNKFANSDDTMVLQDSTAVDVEDVDSVMEEAAVVTVDNGLSKNQETESDYTSRGGNGLVNVRKAYFYNSTNLNSRTNAFIVEGQTVFYSNYEGDFIYAYYTSESGKTIEGWMLMADFEIEPFD